MKASSSKRLRLGVQVFFFVLIAAIAVNHSLSESGAAIPVLSSASLHALCPFGGVVSMYTWATAGTFVRKIHESSFILMGIVLLLAVLVGPAFCGWVCPFGSLQEWIGAVGRRLFGRRYNGFIPRKVDRVLRFLRYGVLGWVVFMTARTGQLIFEAYDPYFALFNLWTGEVAITGLIALAVVILGSLFVERPFCKYACPFGAVLGLPNLVRLFPVRRNAETCIDCKACDRRCPMNIQVSTSRTVRDHQCISCLECTSEHACPVPATVIVSTKAEVKR